MSGKKNENYEPEKDVLQVFVKAYKDESYKKIISKLYTSLQSLNKENKSNVKSRWETEGNIVISQENWKEIGKNGKKKRKKRENNKFSTLERIYMEQCRPLFLHSTSKEIIFQSDRMLEMLWKQRGESLSYILVFGCAYIKF